MNRLLRHIAPFALLASYLPMMVLSSLHVHHDTIDAQDECLHCTGHFEKAHHHDHDCLFCEFLGASYYSQESELTAVQFPATECVPMPTLDMVMHLHYGVSQLRAPPTEC